MNRRVALASVGLAAAALGSAGCMSREATVKDAASAQWTCPTDRIQILSDSPQAAKQPATPPPEIAADPERLALWRKRASAEDPEDPHDVVVSGCGQKATFECRKANATMNDGTTQRVWSCLPKANPNASVEAQIDAMFAQIQAMAAVDPPGAAEAMRSLAARLEAAAARADAGGFSGAAAILREKARVLRERLKTMPATAPPVPPAAPGTGP